MNEQNQSNQERARPPQKRPGSPRRPRTRPERPVSANQVFPRKPERPPIRPEGKAILNPQPYNGLTKFKKKPTAQELTRGIVTLILLIIVLTFMFGGKDRSTAKKINGSNPNQITAGEDGESIDEVFNIGDEVLFRDLVYKVEGFSIEMGRTDDGKFDPDNNFVKIEMTITNKTKTTHVIYGEEFRLLNEDREIFEAPKRFPLYEGKRLDGVQLAPNGKITGWLAMKCPKGTEGLTLVYTGSFYNSDPLFEIKLR